MVSGQLLLSAGENPKIVAERLGHASIVLTLDTYSHVYLRCSELRLRNLSECFLPKKPKLNKHSWQVRYLIEPCSQLYVYEDL